MTRVNRGASNGTPTIDPVTGLPYWQHQQDRRGTPVASVNMQGTSSVIAVGVEEDIVYGSFGAGWVGVLDGTACVRVPPRGPNL